MWKRIGQAAIWFAVYFGLQNVISIAMVMGALLMNPSAIPDPSDMNALMNLVLQLTYDTIMPAMIVSALLYCIIYVVHRRVVHKPLDIHTAEWQKLIFFAGLACVVNVMTNLALTFTQALFPPTWMDALEESVGAVSTGQSMWLLVLGTGIMIPIMEELTFRYGIHKTLAQHNLVFAYIASSLIFGLMHGNPIQIVYAGLLGWLLAYVYTKTDNIWYPMIIHMVSNTSSLFANSFPNIVTYAVTVFSVGLVMMLVTYRFCPNVTKMFKKTQTEPGQP